MAGRLPNFIIVGAAKSGTTSLARWLGAHPDVHIPPAKELYFFEQDEAWARGADWYRSCFAGADSSAAIGEATPNYMFRYEAAERMAAVVPGARLIALLREPGERAHSHYWHWRWRKAQEPRSFAEAVRDEFARPKRAFDDPGNRLDPQYLARGRYLPQLERLCEHFPRESVHVALLDDLERAPAETFAEVCRFLEIDDAIVPDAVGTVANRSFAFRPARLWRLIVRHRHRVPPKLGARMVRRLHGPPEAYPPMEPSVRAALTEHFAEDNAQLAAWLGRDLSHWAR
jgi:hypothetical protein